MGSIEWKHYFTIIDLYEKLHNNFAAHNNCIKM